MYVEYREKAIALRKEGKTYDEILADVPVARSTLSEWLRSVGLAKKQKQKLTRKREAARLKAVESIRENRKKKVLKIESEASHEAELLMQDPFWTLGLALYWGEGDKPKPWTIKQDLRFCNMDR